MMLLVSAFLLLLVWLAVCFVGHGYANTIDVLALFLHRHAVDVRRRHAIMTKVRSESWVRQVCGEAEAAEREEEEINTNLNAFAYVQSQSKGYTHAPPYQRK